MGYTLKCLVSLLFPLLGTLPLLAQEKLDITIVNEDDHQPVPFATISFPKLGYGFSTNGKGNFQLPVDQSNEDQLLVVSSIGYERFERKVSELMESKTDTIFLRANITYLEEIIVKADRDTPEDMMRKTEDELDVFLRKDSYYLFGFYVESIKVNDKYAGYTEGYGVFQIAGHQPAYNRNNSIFSYDIAQWKNIRRSNYAIPSECNPDRKRTLEIDKLTMAKSEYLYNGPFSRTNRNSFTYTLDSATTFDNADVFIIGFAPVKDKSPAYRGRAYIKVDDYALLRMEIEDENVGDIIYENCTIDDISGRFIMTFTKVGEKYYLKDASLTTSYSLNQNRIEEGIALQGGEFKDNSVANLNYDQRMIMYNEMLNPVISYEAGFWQEQDRAIPEKVSNDLGGSETLEKSFFSNNGKRPIPLPDDFNSYEEMYKQQDLFRMFLNSNY